MSNYDNPVSRWLADLSLMTELECMNILQGKSLISNKADLHPISILKNGLDKIRDQANAITSNFTKLFRRLERDRWRQLGENTLQLTCQIRALISLSYSFISDPPPYVTEQEEVVMGECAKLAQQTDRFNQIGENGDGFKIPLVNQLTFLGQSFSRLIDILLGYLVQCIIQYLDEIDIPQDLNTAISTLISLALDGEHMCYIITREGGLRSLFDICKSTTLRSSQCQALRAVATICCVTESIMELERIGGVDCILDILSNSHSSEDLLGEAAGVIAQITSPCLDSNYSISGLLENTEDLVRSLIALCESSTKQEVLLLSTAALANLTFLECSVCEALLQAQAPRVIHQISSHNNKAMSMFTKDQVATILANMAALEVCRVDIVKNNGIEVLLNFLEEGPREERTDSELAACERVQQKAAIALTRLSREAESAHLILQKKGMIRLVRLCRDITERHNSDAVLVACLAALRKICSLCGIGDLSLIDVQQLVQPRLMDSFLICTHRDENFV